MDLLIPRRCVRAGAWSDPNSSEVYDRADSLVLRRCVRVGTWSDPNLREVYDRAERAGAWSDPNSREDNDAAASDACIFALSLCRDAQGTSLLKVRAVAAFEPCSDLLVQRCGCKAEGLSCTGFGRGCCERVNDRRCLKFGIHCGTILYKCTVQFTSIYYVLLFV